MKSVLSALALVTLLGIAHTAAGQNEQDRGTGAYPNRPVRLIVPFSPGALNDTIARVLGQRLTELWGQQVVVDNRAGGGTLIGTELAARSPADGYTLIILSIVHGINPSVHPKMPFNILSDFASVSLIGATPFILAVHPGVPTKNMKEFVGLAKAKPGYLSYGSSGTGGGQHLMGEMLAFMAGIKLLHVPYKGGAPALADVIAGQIHFTFLSYATMGPHIKAGRVRPLAVTSAKRATSTPDIPTIAEEGFPGYEATPWWGLSVPAATSRPLVTRLHADMLRALQSPEVGERFINQGLEIVGSTPQEMDAHLKAEVARWSKVVKAAGIKPD